MMPTKSTLKHFIMLVAVILTCQISYAQKVTLKILKDYSLALRKQKLFANDNVLDRIKERLDETVLTDEQKPFFIKKTNTIVPYKNLNLEDLLYYDSTLGVKKVKDKIIVPLTMYKGMDWVGIEDAEIRNDIIKITLENLYSFYADSSLAIKKYITLFANKLNIDEDKIVLDIQSSSNLSHACIYKVNGRVHVEDPGKTEKAGYVSALESLDKSIYEKLNLILMDFQSYYDPPLIHYCYTLSSSFNLNPSEIDRAFFKFIDGFFKNHPGYIKNVTKIEPGPATVTIYKLKDCITNTKNTYEKLEIILIPRYFDNNILQLVCRCSARSIIANNTTFDMALFEDKMASNLNSSTHNERISALKKEISTKFEEHLKKIYDTK